MSLETLLIGYATGHGLVSDSLIDARDHLPRQALREILRGRRAVLQRVMSSMAEEFNNEADRIEHSPERILVELVRKLLGGEPVDSAELGYDLESWHLGVILIGTNATHAAHALAHQLNRRPLIAPQAQTTVWTWFGGDTELTPPELERAFSADGTPEVLVAVGEPARGTEGWRLTHQQAQAAARVLRHTRQNVTRFADVLLLASVLSDGMSATSLADLYLTPLNRDGDGPALRSTLNAYFAAGHNVRATAAALSVDRNTVRNRLGRIEQRLGYVLHTRQAELEVALRLKDFQDATEESHLH